MDAVKRDELDLTRLSTLLEEYESKLSATVREYETILTRKARLLLWGVTPLIILISALTYFIHYFDSTVMEVYGLTIAGLFVVVAALLWLIPFARYRELIVQRATLKFELRATGISLVRATRYSDELIEHAALSRTDELVLSLRVARSLATIRRASDALGESLQDIEQEDHELMQRRFEFEEGR